MASNDFYGASLGLNTTAQPQHGNTRLQASGSPPSQAAEPSKKTWEQPHHFEPSPPYQSPQPTAESMFHTPVSPQATGQSNFVSPQSTGQTAYHSAHAAPQSAYQSPQPAAAQQSGYFVSQSNLKPQPTIQAVHLAQIPTQQPIYQQPVASPQYQKPQHQPQNDAQTQQQHQYGQQQHHPQHPVYYGNGQPVIVVQKTDNTALGCCLGCAGAICCCGCVVM